MPPVSVSQQDWRHRHNKPARTRAPANANQHATPDATADYFRSKYLSLNVSPLTALHRGLPELLAVAPERVVIEVTEHAQVEDYDALAAGLDRLRMLGVRIAVDDAGSGYASLRHILRLQPNVIKLDIDLTRNIDNDPARRALATSFVLFAREIGATITAEGIETEAESETLKLLHVANGQGYYFAKPAPLHAAAFAAAPTS